MRKLRDDSTWNRLTPDQRETLEGWLFDENLGDAKTLARMQAEFGLEATAGLNQRPVTGRISPHGEARGASGNLRPLPVATLPAEKNHCP